MSTDKTTDEPPSFEDVALALGTAIGEALEKCLPVPKGTAPEIVATKDLDMEGLRVRISMKLEFL